MKISRRKLFDGSGFTQCKNKKKQQKNKVGTMNLQDAKSSHFLKCNPTFIDCKVNSCKAACFNEDFDLFVPYVKKKIINLKILSQFSWTKLKTNVPCIFKRNQR